MVAFLVAAAWLPMPRPCHGATGFFHRFGDPYPRIVQQVFYYVEKKYVEPERASPRALLDGAFEALENQYPEVLVEPAGDGRVRIRVDRAEKTFDLSQAVDYRKAGDLLATALRFVHQNLGEEVEEQDLYYAALNGALAKLDPHSNAFSPKMFKEFMIGTRGTFGGIGFVFGIRDGEMTIISVIEGTPAERGGLRSGDRILYIDGEPTINMPVDVAANKMRGEPGTQVTLTIDREGWPEPRAITFTREVIHVDSVESYVLTEGEGAPVLVARVKNFQKDTTDELRRAAAQALKAHPDLKGLVLDLRNNPGGLLDQAIELSDAFLEEGTIVSTRGPEEDANSRAEAGRDDPELIDRPVVILVNQGSASASEIVSGALKASRA
ncbi:MAG: PDZ domain-containing protein, partial [Candidatus Dadabacteria bacterium]